MALPATLRVSGPPAARPHGLLGLHASGWLRETAAGRDDGRGSTSTLHREADAARGGGNAGAGVAATGL